MAMRELVYQGRVLTRLDGYLAELATQKKRADKVAAANVLEDDPELLRPVPDFALNTWEVLRLAGQLPASRQQIPFSPRLDGCQRVVPNLTFKVPTGGGKTFLAVSALSRIFGRYLGRQKGFVLWIVPNEAIYTQTKRQLADRQHPFRQMLDVLSGNAVRLLEKTDALDARDVGSHLCVMLLMLQASNRQNQDSLKMFRDRGDVHGFLPPEGDQQADGRRAKGCVGIGFFNLVRFQPLLCAGADRHAQGRCCHRRQGPQTGSVRKRAGGSEGH